MRGSKIVLVCLAPAAVAGFAYLAWAQLDSLLPRHIGDLTIVSVARDTDERGRRLLNVTFRSNRNFRRVVKEAAASYVMAQFALCGSKADLGVGRVMHNAIDINESPSENCVSRDGGPFVCDVQHDTPAIRAEIAHMNDPGPFEYRTSVIYEDYCAKEGAQDCEQRVFLSGPPPEDICMQVRSIRLPYRHFPHVTSNEIRIPRAAIARALAQNK